MRKSYSSISVTLNASQSVGYSLRPTKKHRFMKKILIQGKIVVLLFIFFFLFEGVHSSTRTSTTAGGNWTTSSTWVGGVVPVAGDAVFIATSGTGAVNIAANVIQTAAGSVTVNNGAKLTTSKGTITFGSLIINSGGTVTMY